MAEARKCERRHRRGNAAAAIADRPPALESTNRIEQRLQLGGIAERAVGIEQLGIGHVAARLDVALAAIVDGAFARMDAAREGIDGANSAVLDRRTHFILV